MLAAAVSAILFTFALLATFLPVSRLLPAENVAPRAEGELRVHFLSVGQGDCALVEFPEGDGLLIDGGNGSFENNRRVTALLEALQLRSLSLVATHADLDHYGGLAYVIKHFPVQTLYLPILGSEQKAYLSLTETATAHGVNQKTLTRYGGFERESGVFLTCLSPYSIEETDENDASCVLYLSYAGVRVLFGADISAAREERLLREYRTDPMIFSPEGHNVCLENITLIKASHHGSDGSSSQAWLNLLSPEFAVISSGRGNSYSHPTAGALTRLADAGAQIYRTDELGRITFSVSEAGYHINYGGKA